MSDLYLKNLGRREAVRAELQTVAGSLRCCLEQLQLKADPLERPENLDAEGIGQLGFQAAELVIKHRELSAELATVERALGK